MRVVIMGVTGCGKSSVGAAVAADRGAAFADADDFHPRANKDKIAAGIALTDDDRWPWLDEVGAWLAGRPDAVIACSALRRAYRDRLRKAAGPVVFIHLHAPKSVLARRVQERTATEGHFAGVAILDSQYATLEPLGFDEVGGTIDVSAAGAAEVAATALELIALQDD